MTYLLAKRQSSNTSNHNDVHTDAERIRLAGDELNYEDLGIQFGLNNDLVAKDQHAGVLNNNRAALKETHAALCQSIEASMDQFREIITVAGGFSLIARALYGEAFLMNMSGFTILILTQVSLFTIHMILMIPRHCLLI